MRFKTRSKHHSDLICLSVPHCHPFYTGLKNFLNVAVELRKFEKKYKKKIKKSNGSGAMVYSLDALTKKGMMILVTQLLSSYS